jgi:glycosyltransferase involved in cell wall biosynthesis
MQEFNPLVSIIINCYNGEKYLRETIDSVIAQTYTNWEIIFWDNQSTDDTANIVKGYNNSKVLLCS